MKIKHFIILYYNVLNIGLLIIRWEFKMLSTIQILVFIRDSVLELFSRIIYTYDNYTVKTVSLIFKKSTFLF